ncbi:MAG: hypothetical protein FD126_1862 [Elusimicrobia bacterium]|nr:MAG: hypothetical protein FD126_1862 [Elusimicrobiota bacterium]
MCCFSGPVKAVRGTKIFARLDAGRQVLVYEMRVSAERELAMVLPVPTPAGSPEDALRFVSLERHPGFFSELESGFPQPLSESPSLAASALAVHSVGAYEASFVPAPSGFARLDERFRLPAALWEGLPLYRDYGFAVFKLKPGDRKVHPMAFTFPTRHPEALFFPTVHIHDGELHPAAGFDHVLYAQKEGGPAWFPTDGPAREFMTDLSHGLVDPGARCFKQEVRGFYANRDLLVPGPDLEPAPPP